MFSKLFANTGTLVKFIFRRERISTTVWIICILLLTLAVAWEFPNLFGTDEERIMMSQTMNNPAMVAMLGPNYGSDNYTNGAMMSNMMLLFTIVAIAVMNIFLVVKHTRRDEEERRVEVVRSLPVGRLSNLSATMIVAVIINILLALLIGLGLYAMQIEDIELYGSILYGVSCAVSGLLFAAVTAVFCQLASNSRGAIGYSFMFLGVTYLIKCAEAGHDIIVYLSPLSFILKTEAYVRNIWWPVSVLLGISILIAAIAFRLNLRRDLGEGIIPAKPGRKNAKKSLLSSFGLSKKLTRNMFIAWFVTMLLFGMSYGSIFGDFGAFMESNDMFRNMLNVTNEELLLNKDIADLTEEELAIYQELLAKQDETSKSMLFSIELRFVTLLMSIMTILAAVPTLMMLLKTRSEEKKGYNEHLISRTVSRTKLLSCYFIHSIVTSVLMVFAVILGIWSAAYAVMDEPFSFLEVFQSGMIYLPAIWFMVGIGLLLMAYLPRLTGIVWGYLGYSIFAVYLGKLLQLPEWITKLTPFGYVPQIPIDDMNWNNTIILSVIALLFIIVGFIQYKKRDMVF